MVIFHYSSTAPIYLTCIEPSISALFSLKRIQCNRPLHSHIQVHVSRILTPIRVLSATCTLKNSRPPHKLQHHQKNCYEQLTGTRNPTPDSDMLVMYFRLNQSKLASSLVNSQYKADSVVYGGAQDKKKD